MKKISPSSEGLYKYITVYIGAVRGAVGCNVGVM